MIRENSEMPAVMLNEKPLVKWPTPIILALEKLRQKELWVQGQPGLDEEALSRKTKLDQTK